MDALSISSGPDRGEAAVLGRGNQAQFGQMIIGERMRQLKEQQAQEADVKALLGDEVKAKWASDNINYFQPKIEELKKKTIDLYRQKNGKLNDIDMFELKQNWAKLKGEAEVSNALYAEEQDRIKDLGADPKFKKFDQDSWEIRKAWNNPQEQFGSDIEKAGGIIPWRAQNSQAFQNVGAYSMEEHLGKALKDKQSSWYNKGAGGELQKTFDPELNAYVVKTFKGIEPEKLKVHINTIWNDPKDWQAKRMRQSATSWVDKNIRVDESGKISINEGSNGDVLSVVKRLPTTKGMSPDQIKQALGKQYVIENAMARFPATEDFQIIKRDKDSKDGDELSAESFNWASGLQNVSPKNLTAPQVTPEIAQKIVGSKDAASIEKAQQIANAHYAKKMAQYSDKPYVSMTFKGGKDNPRLTYQGRQYISNGFVRKGGKWYMVGTEELSSQNSMAEIIAAIQGNVKDSDKSPKKDLTVQEIQLSPDVAVKHGFTGIHAVNNLTKFLNSQVPADF